MWISKYIIDVGTLTSKEPLISNVCDVDIDARCDANNLDDCFINAEAGFLASTRRSIALLVESNILLLHFFSSFSRLNFKLLGPRSFSLQAEILVSSLFLLWLMMLMLVVRLFGVLLLVKAQHRPILILLFFTGT